ncbi:N-acetyltransferase family protein [Streptomyces sp. NPDC001999]
MSQDRFLVREVRPADVDAALALVVLAGQAEYADAPGQVALTRRMIEMLAAGDPVLSEDGIVLVAEESETGRIVGAATAGPPGIWSHQALEHLPRQPAQQLRTQLGEVYEIGIDPGFRRLGLGARLMDGLLEHRVARRWRLVLWFFHGDDARAVAFNEALAPSLETGTTLNFLGPDGREVWALRELKEGLRACLGPLHRDVRLVVGTNGVRAVKGFFTGRPWELRDGRLVEVPAPRSAKTTKAELKQAKKARGRARG